MATNPSPDVNAQLALPPPVATLVAAQATLKSGFLTSEFSALIAGMLGALALALKDKVSPEIVTAALTLAPLLFGLLRNALKKAHNEKVQGLLETLLDSAQKVIVAQGQLEAKVAAPGTFTSTTVTTPVSAPVPSGPSGTN